MATASLPLPPTTHAAAPLWLARGALQHGDINAATLLLPAFATADNPLAVRLRGEILLAQGDFPQAINVWMQAGDYIALAQAGHNAHSQEQWYDASLAYQSAWLVNPIEGTLPVVEFLRDVGQIADAIAVLQQSLDTYPHARERRSWWHRLSWLLYGEARMIDSVAVLRAAIREFPTDISLYLLLGEVLYARGDGADSAQAVWQQAIALDPANGEGYMRIAKVLAREKRHAEAETWFHQGVARNPDAIGWWLARAHNLRDGGDLGQAFELYQGITERFPDNAEAYYEIAATYRLQERKAAAVTALEQALRLTDKPHIGHFMRAGDIFEWAQLPQPAVDQYRAALQLDPQNKDAQIRLRRVTFPDP